MPLGKIGLPEEYAGTIKSGVFTITDQFVLATEDRWPRGTANNLIASFTFSSTDSLFQITSSLRSNNDGYIYTIYDDTGYLAPRTMTLNLVMNRSAICTALIPGPDISGYHRSFGVGNWAGPEPRPGSGQTGNFPAIRLTPGKNTVQVYIAGRNPTTLYSSANPIYVIVRDV
jgi:hypothetical protein